MGAVVNYPLTTQRGETMGSTAQSTVLISDLHNVVSARGRRHI
jgi:hypothetical protein